MLLLPDFTDNLSEICPDFKTRKHLLALSGGVDSMVLAHLFLHLGLSFQAAHINYKLRSSDSDADQKIVENFCFKNKIPLQIYEVSEKDLIPQHSVQLWARELRYNFFREICEKENLDFTVTAHHLNDQLETFIINLSKASGIKGLSGIPRNENQILRPLLHFSKQEIYDFAGENKIAFREDLSNKKNDYLRNKIRNEITPKLLETNGNFLKNFDQSLEFLHQAKSFIAEKIHETETRISFKKDGNSIFDKRLFSAESDFVQFEILKKYGFIKTSEIDKIFSSATGSFFYSENYQILVNRNELILSRKNPVENNAEIILSEEFSNENESGEISLNNIEMSFDKSFRWKFDSDKIKHPIKLRRKAEGDIFYPTGFDGKKKVSKYFKDEKLSILAKQKIWLLSDAEDRILGILPYRQDRRFAENENTKRILTLFYEKDYDI
ncbi:tRNA(Ile)-lysidine synthetase [Chryseobacterium sp. Leaf180]|uniref:tRNA lysidine(34) synthetase TilS n=1 Tax=Chryseobacterium sp. Leaf180 TaxID=1736289 RepID=UPI0006F294AC|nr:tRNA lysidine(34) synthetase TilS [Chryseobacterium sp. Leaf180]KQR93841.1 tRNA(Ile)-lysidine synthetase [Chryseobacterium sp. Leaf180]